MNVGTGGTGSTGNGQAGNPSWFGTTGTVYAEGGAGGARANIIQLTDPGQPVQLLHQLATEPTGVETELQVSIPVAHPEEPEEEVQVQQETVTMQLQEQEVQQKI